MATPLTFDPSTYNSATVAPFTLGEVYNYRGVLYRFVKVVTNASANGDVMCMYDDITTPTWEVIGANRTTALAGTPAAIIAVGVAVGVISVGQYGFIQVSGIHTSVKSGTSTLGYWQAPVTTNDSCGDATASIARTETLLGVCIQATSGGRAQVQLRGLV